MVVEQRKWTEDAGWVTVSDQGLKDKAQWVLVFGGRQELGDEGRFSEVKAMYPGAHIVSCSTAGEIIGTEVLDHSWTVTAVYFASTGLKFASTGIGAAEESYTAGKSVAEKLIGEGLVHVMVFSEGLKVNGTELIRGMIETLPAAVSVTGGLVGDGADFKETIVGLDDRPRPGVVVGVGFYGSSLRVGYGSLGGWDPFGPERIITRAKDNVLYELDGKQVLPLYKEYLGDQAAGLPGSGLLFPLSLRLKSAGGEEVSVVRTVLAMDEAAQSLTFAGSMPEGAPAQLMKANFDRLVDGAEGAANMGVVSLGSDKAELAILISCIGRKLVLKERTEEELDAVARVVGPQAVLTGFYSYGEICPTAPTSKQCQLHNQTMTITTFHET